MSESVIAYLCGVIFALGLGISGMTQPAKVTAFLDFTGNWDPSLMFVMVGAIAVYALGYRFAIKKSRPILADTFAIPQNKFIDRRLVLGAALFGAGWGLAGFCPGPALTSVVTLSFAPLLFVAAMMGGMFLFERIR